MHNLKDLHAIYIRSKVYELLQHESNLKKKNLGSSTYLQPLFWISVIGASRWFSKLLSLLCDGVFLKIKTVERRVRDQDLYIKLWFPIKPRCFLFATTISNLWNMLLHCKEVRWSGGGLGQGVGPLQSCERVCERVADNILSLGPHL